MLLCLVPIACPAQEPAETCMAVSDEVTRAKLSCAPERLAVVTFSGLAISRCDVSHDAKDKSLESPGPLLTGELERFLGVVGGLIETPCVEAGSCRPTERRGQHVAPLLLTQALETDGDQRETLSRTSGAGVCDAQMTCDYWRPGDHLLCPRELQGTFEPRNRSREISTTEVNDSESVQGPAERPGAVIRLCNAQSSFAV